MPLCALGIGVRLQQLASFVSMMEERAMDRTGCHTITAIQRELPTRLIMPSTVTRVVFGA
jgi:hypothetical protein